MTDKKLVRREFPQFCVADDDLGTWTKPTVALGMQQRIDWYEQCGADLAAGRHIEECGCTLRGRITDAIVGHDADIINVDWSGVGCKEIARRMVGFAGYEVSVEVDE